MCVCVCDLRHVELPFRVDVIIVNHADPDLSAKMVFYGHVVRRTHASARNRAKKCVIEVRNELQFSQKQLG